MDKKRKVELFWARDHLSIMFSSTYNNRLPNRWWRKSILSLWDTKKKFLKSGYVHCLHSLLCVCLCWVLVLVLVDTTTILFLAMSRYFLLMFLLLQREWSEAGGTAASKQLVGKFRFVKLALHICWVWSLSRKIVWIGYWDRNILWMVMVAFWWYL